MLRSVMATMVVVVGVVLLGEFATVAAAPAVCRSCSNNCFAPTNTSSSTNSTSNGATGSAELDLMTELETNDVGDESGRRSKRDVEQRACQRFQVEMLLIPLAIAMIPLVLCALFVCTCFCGPKESRGKLPEDFLASLPMSKKREGRPEEFELEFGDGYVQRKDSSRTKFSTTVSYIEARRESLWSSKSNTDMTDDTRSEGPPVSTLKFLPLATASVPASPATLKSAVPARITKADSFDSMKKTRFSDTVSVISVDSLSRR